MSCLCISSCKKEDPNKVFKTAVQENVVYKIFPTTNMWNFIKLDTRNGKMWQVQYSTFYVNSYSEHVQVHFIGPTKWKDMASTMVI